MKKKLLHNHIEYKFVKVPNFLKEFCCTFCAFSNNYANGCKSYCGNIPDSGCCNPFKEFEYYGFWKKVK